MVRFITALALPFLVTLLLAADDKNDTSSQPDSSDNSGNKSPANTIVEIVPVLESEIELIRERHNYKDFQYITANTRVERDYDDISPDSNATLKGQHGMKECKTPIFLKLPHFLNNCTICLFKDLSWNTTAKTSISVDGTTYDVKKFKEMVQPVRGYVVKQINSLVKGYLLDGNFYGTIRVYDSNNAYHIHFYVEPVDNLSAYSKTTTELEHQEEDEDESGNAIVFEFVGNEEESKRLRPPEDIAKEQYEMRQKKSGGRPLTDLTEIGLSIGAMNKKMRKEMEKGKKAEIAAAIAAAVAASYANKSQNEDDDDDDSRKKRKRETSNSIGVPIREPKKGWKNETVGEGGEVSSNDILLAFHDDVVDIEQLEGGLSKSNVFDTASAKAYLCKVCIWIEPLFAEVFGLRGGRIYGAAEIYEVMRRLDWYLRAVDFNQDNIAENFGLIINNITVTDDISVQEVPSQAEEKGEEHPIPTAVKGNPKAVYKELLSKITSYFGQCCAILAFVYMDLTPVLSVSSIRGVCGKNNLILVSGALHGHKVGIFDVQRAAFHGIGHLLGSQHDRIMRSRCQDKKPYRYYNPFVMHPVAQANVGARMNSYRFSICSKMEISAMLNSNNILTCLEKTGDSFCGNGMIDKGEECDCGSPWQCHLDECCGESDTLFKCRMTKLGKAGTCARPQVW